MKYFTIFLILIGFAFISPFILSPSEAVSTGIQCDVNNDSKLKEIEKNPAIHLFLEFHPSSLVETHQTSDKSGNPTMQIEYRHNGLGLVVEIFKNENSENCFVGSYNVSYDYPPSGLGVSLSKSNHFESDQIQQTVSAIKDLTNPRKQMKEGIPLYEIKCKEGLNPIFKRDRVHPACVTDSSGNELLMRGWTPLRMGMPAETNILITYNATMVYPQKVTKEYDPRSPYFNLIFFVNNDIVPHTVNAIDDSWSTGIIESGQMGSMSFNQTGSYKYYVAEKQQTTGRIQFEPMPEPEPTYTLTEVHCFPNQIIYNDECVYLLAPTDEFPKKMTKYFLMVDDVIINFCEIESTTLQDREYVSGKTLDTCFEISSYTLSDVNVIEFQSTTPPTWINIKIENLTRNVELGSSPTFSVIESGWGNGCTSPTLEVYHMKQEIGNDHTSDDLIYKHRIVYSCPYYKPIYPPLYVLRIWDESDFPEFPICEEQGRYLIIGDSGYERLPLDYYYCGIENENENFDN
ncbi:MAG: hypothetical protein OEL81_00900 [Nitrosopumilus sp.]|nr:hypothetical protein [Nitrosopumilus sp.]